MRRLYLAETCEVFTTSGLKKIRDLSCDDKKILSKNKWLNITNVKKESESNVYKIETKYGFSTTLSADNDISCIENKKIISRKANNLIVGNDLLIMPNNFAHIRKNVHQEVNEELAYLLGLSYGDGYIRRNKKNEPVSLTISCSDDQPEIINKIEMIAKNVFDYDVKIKNGDGKVKNVSIYSKSIMRDLNNKNVIKQKSADLFFPSFILGSNKNIQNGFIAGYFDADGYVGKQKKGYTFSSISLPFLSSIQKILLCNGIMSKIHKEKRKNDKWKDLYTLRVTGGISQSLFYKKQRDLSVKVKDSPFFNKADKTIFSLGNENFSKDKITKINEEKEDIYSIFIEENDCVYNNGFLI
jgi:intein/homing endonuclease